MVNKLKIAVLTGGYSPERDVSLASGLQIATALRARGHKVILVDPALGDGPIREGDKVTRLGIGPEPPSLEELPRDFGQHYIRCIDYLAHQGIDVVFNGLHGGAGEDGTIQGLLDLAGLPYTGTGVLGSALAMNKVASKRIFERVGIRTPEWLLVDGQLSEWESVARAVATSFGFPAVVKPSNQGSTVGVSRVNGPEELAEALRKARMYSQEVIIERFIAGREITVALLAGEALPVVEIIPEHGFYDYECKYSHGKSRYEVPAPIPEPTRLEAQEMAVKAYQVLYTQDYGRVDMRYREDGKVYCLEMNTLPGMTGISLVPKAARAAGMEFAELCERIVELALRRAQGSAREQ
ncbi:MAG: D-alanine--D-alanine ligase [bacterium]|nr:D-alanine--D-alanine ligase [candidate division KSB1 bacterium]MDH7560090.1 D-alanine--D-alanine ligase [bacterium]